MKKFLSITRTTSRRTSLNKKILVIGALGVTVLVLIVLLPRLFAGVSALVFVPVHSVVTYFSESSAALPSYVRDRSALVQEIEQLQQQLAQETDADKVAAVLRKENETLRDLLGDSPTEKILAGVIGRPNQLPFDVLVLDKGFDEGIVEGAPVFVGESAVVGLITKTFSHSALVTLITSPGFETSVYVAGPDIYTTAYGIGGGVARIGVPQGVSLQEGDSIILPGVSSALYGTVDVVESVPSKPEQYGYVVPSIPLAGIRMVGVGTQSLSPLSFEEAQEIVSQTKQTYLTVPVPDDILIQTDSASSTNASSTATTSPRDL